MFATVTAVIWGGQFVVGKSALARVDAFPLTAIRYGIAAVLLLALLAAVEGRGALRLDGTGRRLFLLGSLGFAGFNLFAYTGLEHARPQSASLIVALGPLVTAIVLWLRDGTRPSRTTAVALVVAIVGVALVVSGGHPSTIVDGSVGWGDGLVLLGVISFVVYTLGAARARRALGPPVHGADGCARLDHDPRRRADRERCRDSSRRRPSADVGAVTPEILYLAIPGALIAVLTWNAAVEQDRAAERLADRQSDPGDDVRDRDRARLPARGARARRAPRSRSRALAANNLLLRAGAETEGSTSSNSSSRLALGAVSPGTLKRGNACPARVDRRLAQRLLEPEQLVVLGDPVRRAGAPVLIWPALVATARSAIDASSVSPERWEMIAT